MGRRKTILPAHAGSFPLSKPGKSFHDPFFVPGRKVPNSHEPADIADNSDLDRRKARQLERNRLAEAAGVKLFSSGMDGE